MQRQHSGRERATSTLRKIKNYSADDMSLSELTWLRRWMRSSNTAVREAAEKLHDKRLPYYGDYIKAKESPLQELTFYLYGVNDEAGSEKTEHVKYSITSTGRLTQVLYEDDNANEDACYKVSEKKETAKVAQAFMRLILRKLDKHFLVSDTPKCEAAPDKAQAGDFPGGSTCMGELFWTLSLTYHNGYTSDIQIIEGRWVEAILLKDEFQSLFNIGPLFLKLSRDSFQSETW